MQIDSSLVQAFSLKDRVAVITGAASGIGRETAHVLSAAGAHVVIGDINYDGIEDCARAIGESGARAVARRADVSNRHEIDALAQEAINTFGRLDIWVSAAGMLINSPILEASESDLDRMLSVNLKSAYWSVAAAGRAMQQQRSGSIVNISSAGAESAVPGLSMYSLTKAAMNMVTRSAAKELGPLGIRVNAVAPGWVDTPMGTHSFLDVNGAIDPVKQAEGLRQRRQASPLGITGTPRDIALAVLYLASDASRFVTGQILRPNGGVAMP